MSHGLILKLRLCLGRPSNAKMTSKVNIPVIEDYLFYFLQIKITRTALPPRLPADGDIPVIFAV